MGVSTSDVFCEGIWCSCKILRVRVRFISETGYEFNLNKGNATDSATVARIVVLQLALLLLYIPH